MSDQKNNLKLTGARMSPDFYPIIDEATGESLFWYTTDFDGIHFDPDHVRRIVACVNACEGFSTKTLELIASVGGMQNKMVATHTVARQNDQLLVVLANAESFIAGFEDDELQEGVAELLAEIRTALKGGDA